MEVHGTFDVQRFYDTLALIISQRENVKVTVEVIPTLEKEKKQLDRKKAAG